MTARPLLLVLRALGLGDLLTAVPALRGLAAARPDGELVLAAPAVLAPLAQLTGTVHRVVDTAALAPIGPLDRRPDLAVNLHGRGPQSTRLLLATQPTRLVAFHHPDLPATVGQPTHLEDEHEVSRWCRLLAESDIPADPRRLELARPAGDFATGCSVVHPGAAYPSRRWPVDRWAAVARALTDRGERVVVTGSAAEHQLACAVAAGAGLPAEAVLAGRTSLRQLAGLVAAAHRVVCPDTGVAHLATAYRTPSVVLFGPVSPAWWGPPVDRPEHRTLWAGRRGNPFATEPDPGLLEISVADVLAAVDAGPARPVELGRGAAGKPAPTS